MTTEDIGNKLLEISKTLPCGIKFFRNNVPPLAFRNYSKDGLKENTNSAWITQTIEIAFHFEIPDNDKDVEQTVKKALSAFQEEMAELTKYMDIRRQQKVGS